VEVQPRLPWDTGYDCTQYPTIGLEHLVDFLGDCIASSVEFVSGSSPPPVKLLRAPCKSPAQGFRMASKRIQKVGWRQDADELMTLLLSLNETSASRTLCWSHICSAGSPGRPLWRVSVLLSIQEQAVYVC
jgi:hypothetical protein